MQHPGSGFIGPTGVLSVLLRIGVVRELFGLYSRIAVVVAAVSG